MKISENYGTVCYMCSVNQEQILSLQARKFFTRKNFRHATTII